MGLLNHVIAARRGDHLLVIDVSQARNASDRGSIASQLIGTDRVWDVIFAKQPDQEGSRSLRISVALKENIEHEAVLVHCPPEPVSDAVVQTSSISHREPCRGSR